MIGPRERKQTTARLERARGTRVALRREHLRDERVVARVEAPDAPRSAAARWATRGPAEERP